MTDIKTGKPISGARVGLQYYYFETGSRKPQGATVSTDGSGEFSYAAEKNPSEGIGVWEVQKEGYASVFDSEREKGGCDNVQIKLVPYDGLLKLNITNQTGTYNSAYVEVASNCSASYGYDPYQHSPPYPLALLPGASYAQTFNGCVGDSAAIRWKFTENGSWINVGSVLIETADTTFFSISY